MTIQDHEFEDIAPVCLYCLRLKWKEHKDRPRRALVDNAPCSFCEKLMRRGILLIEVDGPRSECLQDNPKRTGRVAVVKRKGIKKLLDEKTANSILERGFAFVSKDDWEGMQLKRGGKHEKSINDNFGDAG